MLLLYLEMQVVFYSAHLIPRKDTPTTAEQTIDDNQKQLQVFQLHELQQYVLENDNHVIPSKDLTATNG